MKYLLITLSSIVVAYLVILLFIYFYQRNLLYHPSENNYQNDEAEFNYEEVYIEVDNDIKLKSWFINKDLKKFKTLLVLLLLFPASYLIFQYAHQLMFGLLTLVF